MIRPDLRPLARRLAVAGEVVDLRADRARLRELEVAVAENSGLAVPLAAVVADLEARLVPLLERALEDADDSGSQDAEDAEDVGGDDPGEPEEG